MRTPEEIEELRAAMNKIDWWHTIDLGDGLITPGREPAPRSRDPYLRIPEDLTGKSVLDIGAWDGLYSFEAEKRGADRVIACDLPDSQRDGFEFARTVLSSRVILFRIDAEYLDENFIDIATFPGEPLVDVVFCFGVLYHLNNGPMPLLRTIHSIMNKGGLLIVETALAGIPATDTPLLEFVEHEREGDETNWFYPNTSAMQAMLRATGFTDVEYTGGVSGRGTFHARKH